jgi:hypothetical protein
MSKQITTQAKAQQLCPYHNLTTSKLSGVSKVKSSGIWRHVVRWTEGKCCPLHADFLVGVLFDTKDVGDMFLRNVGWLLTDFRAICPIRLDSSQPPLQVPRILYYEYIKGWCIRRPRIHLGMISHFVFCMFWKVLCFHNFFSVLNVFRYFLQKIYLKFRIISLPYMRFQNER